MPHKKMDMDCEKCHNTGEWEKVNFDHSKTQFELRDRHEGVPCTSCHTIEDFSQVRKACDACHLDVHQGKLPYACETCHSPESWSVLDIYKVHANTSFPILGAHSRLDCDACHRSEIVGEFSRLQSDCYSCHEKDYRETKNPVHSDFGFGHRCEDCHALFSWRPASFSNHDSQFPISSGTHAGEWESCNDCHINPGNYQVFNCLNCHEHSRAQTIGRHDEVRGFSYDSNSCYQCHPTGRAEGD
ncbi:MAG: hypothetical protein GXO75_02730 [Calditrichaeota bacterium]|nr:hypothetical protein [Calditrichota bacterium]